jgi:hypothetical protein
MVAELSILLSSFSAVWRYTILMTSITVTNPPALKVMTRTTFRRNSIRREVMMGRGKSRIARSVRMLTGACERYSVTMSMQVPEALEKAA